MANELQNFTRPLKVPRRRPKACKQCRASKVKCSGDQPCARCIRRSESCMFQNDEPYVSIPAAYLKSLERRIADLDAPSPDESQETIDALSVPGPNLALPQPDLCGDHDGPRPSTSNTGPTTAQSDSVDEALADPAITARHPRLLDPDTSASERVADNAGREVINSSNSSDETRRTDEVSPHNPLIGRSLTYLFDHVGRPRCLGSTSSWSFCRRALALLESTSPASYRPPAPLNLDGTAFRLTWESKPVVEIQDVCTLPSHEYATYLYNTVKFRLGELLGIIDEQHFMAHWKLFRIDPYQTAKAHRLWFVEYLFVMAFGKAFLNHPGQSETNSPPGSEHAARAMSLMPDVAQMHDESLLALEVLTLAALYFQSIDMRASAYQLIGQALRLAYIEGLHLQVPDDVIDPAFAKRCNKDWWVVYILDRELTSMMGCPNNQVESEITASVPRVEEPDLLIDGFKLRIRLSSIIARISSTVYSVEKEPGQPFIDNTTAILHQLAGVSQELKEVVLSCKQSTNGELPGIFKHITLSYHHCIVLATRPLVMWLFVLALPPSFSEPQLLAAPREALLHAAAESASSILLMLAALAKRNLLEPFLPFQLECAFSSAMLLSLLGAILPSYIPDSSWKSNAFAVFDEMILARNVVAPLRKAEVQEIEELLAPVRRNPIIAAETSNHGRRWNVVETPRQHVANGMSLDDDDIALTSDFNVGHTSADGSFLSAWAVTDGGMPTVCDVDYVLELAGQLEMGDMGTSFLLS